MWGSLIWNPQNLPIMDWHKGGPKLHIEFSRISNDDRLTLVIDPEMGELVQTQYALSQRSNLNDAIKDLSKREKTSKAYIGFVDLIHDRHSSTEDKQLKDIKVWCKENQIDAAVWTALPPKFNEFSIENAVAYLDRLGPKQDRAYEYIQKAPEEIDTP